MHTRRNQLGADLAMLVVGATAGGACGVGYVMTGLSSAFAAYAFTVTAYPCISPNYTFAHELGHNMGSAHAPEDGAGQGSLYPYSFGYKHPSNLFRTVMAYNCAGRLPARAALLESERGLRRRAHRHGGAARQRALDQQRRQHHRQLAAGGRRRHGADHLGRGAT